MPGKHGKSAHPFEGGFSGRKNCALLTQALLLVLLVLSAAQAFGQDAIALFREEMMDAPVKIGWRGAPLEDETRLAVAASGLSWKPVWNGQPLLRTERKGVIYADAAQRREAFEAAARANAPKFAFAYALSLVLEPPAQDERTWLEAFRYLSRYDAEFDRVLIGVLQAPSKLPLLPVYDYAAADVLMHRASSRLLTLFLTLSESSDRYLRSRAVAALGIVAYRERPGSGNRVAGLAVALRENSISAVQQRIIYEQVRKAAEDKNYQSRAAAAFALGLMGDERDIPRLERLMRDPAYLSLPTDERETRRIIFPVRTQAAAALARFGQRAETGNGLFAGRALREATRGGKNVTNDYGDLRRDRRSLVPSLLRFTEGIQ
jgi:HEAT repeat protein